MVSACLVWVGKVDVFNKFKDNRGNFKESLIKDVRGMLSLYEATHMRVHGEDMLDETLKITTTHLESMVINLSPPFATQMKKLVEAYFEEAIWLKEIYIPTMVEYMSNALISYGYPMLSTISFVGMGDIVIKEVLEWVFKEPNVVIAASIINRLMDDIVFNEFEQKRVHVTSGIECYKKHYSVSKQEMHAEFYKQIVDAWKDINKECIRPTKVPITLLTHVVNFA
ncbi:hypothetical protein SO802_029578 [Lithocarpus litseifolius]|uniref:Terpene synthase metal-binding domain-containing protein n=1 Tax=Lithocarpus litseifolius TaxID=425828 RepID=A0AAW2BWV1_9ROSI